MHWIAVRDGRSTPVSDLVLLGAPFRRAASDLLVEGSVVDAHFLEAQDLRQYLADLADVAVVPITDADLVDEEPATAAGDGAA